MKAGALAPGATQLHSEYRCDGVSAGLEETSFLAALPVQTVRRIPLTSEIWILEAP